MLRREGRDHQHLLPGALRPADPLSRSRTPRRPPMASLPRSQQDHPPPHARHGRRDRMAEGDVQRGPLRDRHRRRPLRGRFALLPRNVIPRQSDIHPAALPRTLPLRSVGPDRPRGRGLVQVPLVRGIRDRRSRPVPRPFHQQGQEGQDGLPGNEHRTGPRRGLHPRTGPRGGEGR